MNDRRANIKLPCEVVEDLLPSYVEGLTSETTGRMVEEHFTECDSCRRKYVSMKDPFAEQVNKADDKKAKREIDFLKKTRSRFRRTLLAWICLIGVLAGSVIGAKYCLIGSPMNAEYLAYYVEVNGYQLILRGSAINWNGIKQVTFSEEDGKVDIAVTGVEKNLLYASDFEECYVSRDPITEVRLDGNIIWANGKSISPITSHTFAAYNPYVGDMPANFSVVSALQMTVFTGNYTNELQTKEEPYGWKLILERDFGNRDDALIRQRLRGYACALLAEIGNLSEVTYEYHLDGQLRSLTVTVEDATRLAGRDIKEIGQHIDLLEELLGQFGLTGLAYGRDLSEQDFENALAEDQKLVRVEVADFAEDPIYGLYLNIDYSDCDGFQAVASQGMIHADDTPLASGELVSFCLLPEDFYGKHDLDGVTGKIHLQVLDGPNSYDVEGEIETDLRWGNAYRIYLKGNAAEGYRIE